MSKYVSLLIERCQNSVNAQKGYKSDKGSEGWSEGEAMGGRRESRYGERAK